VNQEAALNQEHPILFFEAALVEAQLTGDVAAHRSGQLRITKMRPLEHHITSLGPVTVVSIHPRMASAIQRMERGSRPHERGGEMNSKRSNAVVAAYLVRLAQTAIGDT